jgi:tellurite resistance protein
MTIQFANLAEKVAADGMVSPEEILSLRRLGWGDGEIHRGEAEAIFRINNLIKDQSDEWVDFFVEAIGEFVLNGTEPRGMCDEHEARWLITQIDHDGRLESMAELETLVRIIEKAENVPDVLKFYALEQVEEAVLNGRGPTRKGGDLSDSHISDAECGILRRLIFAAGGFGPAAVSRQEAEMLFRIKDKTLTDQNSPLWEQLFLDGVANYIKGFQLTNAQLSHERAKELGSFISDNKASVGRFFGRMARDVPQARNHLGRVFGKKAEGNKYAEAQVAGNEITDQEQQWLNGMVEADGELDDLERKLLRRLAEED